MHDEGGLTYAMNQAMMGVTPPAVVGGAPNPADYHAGVPSWTAMLVPGIMLPTAAAVG